MIWYFVMIRFISESLQCVTKKRNCVNGSIYRNRKAAFLFIFFPTRHHLHLCASHLLEKHPKKKLSTMRFYAMPFTSGTFQNVTVLCHFLCSKIKGYSYNVSHNKDSHIVFTKQRTNKCDAFFTESLFFFFTWLVVRPNFSYSFFFLINNRSKFKDIFLFFFFFYIEVPHILDSEKYMFLLAFHRRHIFILPLQIIRIQYQ